MDTIRFYANFWLFLYDLLAKIEFLFQYLNLAKIMHFTSENSISYVAIKTDREVKYCASNPIITKHVDNPNQYDCYI